jgi:hypothetical protein
VHTPKKKEQPIFVAPFTVIFGNHLQKLSLGISMSRPWDKQSGVTVFCDYAPPEMTKPPEGGSSPQEHLAQPDGRGVSRIASVPKTPANLMARALRKERSALQEKTPAFALVFEYLVVEHGTEPACASFARVCP